MKPLRKLFYGRRGGREQEAFPPVLIELLEKERGRRLLRHAPCCWCEIGFGGGEHLLSQLQDNPNTLMVGLEPYRPGLLKLWRRLLALEDDKREGLLQRLILTEDPVQLFLEENPKALFERIDILFPDPWPKKRHHKRRLIQVPFLHKLQKHLTDGGAIHVATDHEDYANHITLTLRQLPEWCVTQTLCNEDQAMQNTDPSWSLTRYAQKARKKGIRLVHFELRKKLP
jgi:tRNA (guanine-N7-)-methyltransferase